MNLAEVRKGAKYAAENTDSYEVRALAKAILGLCDIVDSHDVSMTVAFNNIEVEERLGRAL